MTRTTLLLVASCVISTAAACKNPDSWPTRAEDLAAIRDPQRTLPPGATPHFITLGAACHPAWHVRGHDGVARTASEMRGAVGVPVVLLLRSDRKADFRIPAMRVTETVVPGMPTVVWFVPVAAGVYPVLVRSDLGQCNGALVVKE